MANYPTSLDTLTNPSAGQKTNDPSVPHATQHANANDILEALEAKLGIGASTPAANKVLAGTGAGASAWTAAGSKGQALLAGTSTPLFEPLARRNRLINGTMLVCQRATMPTADDSYCLDQWNLLLEAANAATVAQETSDFPTDGSKRGLRLTVGSGNNNKFGVVNFMEFLNCADLQGKTGSLQLKLKSTAGITDVRAAVIEWTSTADSITSDVVETWGDSSANPTLASNWAYCSGYTPVSLAPTTSWATYKIEGVSIGASANNLGVFIWVNDKTTTQTTDILRITDVQFEEGTICTDVERPSLQLEFELCLRYYERLGGVTNIPIANGYNHNTNSWQGGMFWTPNKRIIPAVSFAASSNFGITNSSGGSVITVSTGPNAVYIDKRSALLTATTASGLTAGHGGSLLDRNASGIVEITAEL